MFDEVDLGVLKLEIKKATQELKEVPKINPRLFIPLVKNLILYNLSGFREEIHLEPFLYRIYLDTDDFFYDREAQYENNLTIKEITYKNKEIDVEKEKKVFLFFKKQIIEKKIIKEPYERTILYLEFSLNNKIENALIDEFEITQIRTYSYGDDNFSQNDINLLYFINDIYKQKTIKKYEEKLYNLQQEVALKKINASLVSEIVFK